MTTARIMTPARAKACDIPLVAAAKLRKIADMVNITMNEKRKNVKNLDTFTANPPRKYRIILKTTAIANLIGISLTIPARASVKG
jgi:hypothetical protein